MFSKTLPGLLAPETADAVFGALCTVAEQSFFAPAERCEETTFETLAAGVPVWLVSTIRFEEGRTAGTMSCSLPDALAERLFHAFTGRDPSDPPPPAADVDDLVGEFANMVCGAWLSRAASGRAFALGQPAVVRTHAAAAGALGLRVVVDDSPMTVAVQIEPEARAVAALPPGHGRAGA